MPGDKPGQSAGSHHSGVLPAHLRLGLADQVLHGPHITSHHASLDVAYSGEIQGLFRLIQLHVGQHGGVGRQRVHGHPKPGGNTAALVHAIFSHRIHGGGGAEVQHDHRPAIFLHSRHTGHRPVWTQPFIGDHGAVAQTGVHVHIGHDGLETQVFYHGSGEGIHHLGHHRGHHHRLQPGPVQSEPLEILAHQQADLI